MTSLTTYFDYVSISSLSESGKVRRILENLKELNAIKKFR